MSDATESWDERVARLREQARAQAKAEALLADMDRGVSAGVGAKDRWTSDLLGKAKRGALITGMAAVVGAAASPFWAGGPAWKDSTDHIDLSPKTAWSQEIGALEQAYANRFERTTPVVVDVDVLREMVDKRQATDIRQAVDTYVTARLQDDGTYTGVNYYQLAGAGQDKLNHPAATGGYLVGYANGEELSGLPFRRVAVVTTHHGGLEGREGLEGTTGLPYTKTQTDAFWQKYTTLHELEHVSEYDRLSALEFAIPHGEARVTNGELDDKIRGAYNFHQGKFASEVYADVKTAMTSIAETGSTDTAHFIADVRAIEPAVYGAQGKIPRDLDHFTAPAVNEVIADYDAGKLDLSGIGTALDRTRAQDDKMHELAMGYVDQAVAQYETIDLGKSFEVLRDRGKGKLSEAPGAFAEAGWPASWTQTMAKAVDSYQAFMDCQVVDGQAHISECLDMNADREVAVSRTQTRFVEPGRDLSGVESAFAKDLPWGARDPALGGEGNISKAEIAGEAGKAHGVHGNSLAGGGKTVAEVGPELPRAGTPDAVLGASAGAARMLEEAGADRLDRTARQQVRALRLAGTPDKVAAFAAQPPARQAQVLSHASGVLARAGEQVADAPAGAIARAMAGHAREVSRAVAELPAGARSTDATRRKRDQAEM